MEEGLGLQILFGREALNCGPCAGLRFGIAIEAWPEVIGGWWLLKLHRASRAKPEPQASRYTSLLLLYTKTKL